MGGETPRQSGWTAAAGALRSNRWRTLLQLLPAHGPLRYLPHVSRALLCKTSALPEKRTGWGIDATTLATTTGSPVDLEPVQEGNAGCLTGKRNGMHQAAERCKDDILLPNQETLQLGCIACRSISGVSNTRQAGKKRDGALARQRFAQRQEARLILKWARKGMQTVCLGRETECIRLPSDAGRHKIPMHLQLEFTACRLCANLSNTCQLVKRMSRDFHKAALCPEMATLCQNRSKNDFSQSYQSDTRE